MNISPRNYNLTFEPDLEKFTFRGTEILTFEIKEKTKLNNVPLDSSLSKLIKTNILKKERNYFSINFVVSFRISSALLSFSLAVKV